MSDKSVVEACSESARLVAQHETLPRFAGTWRAVVKIWMNPANPPQVSTGTMVNRLVLGGRFIEQGTQAIALDLLQGGIERAEEAGFRVFGHYHDEILTEVDVMSGKSLKGLIREMVKLEPWAKGMPVSAAGSSATAESTGKRPPSSGGRLNMRTPSDSPMLRSALSERFAVGLPDVATQQESADGTTKFLLRLRDGASIETVDIPETTRRTLCISSQAGCGLACAFCVTGYWGAGRNLSAGEIVGQVMLVRKLTRPRLSDKKYPGQRAAGHGLRVGDLCDAHHEFETADGEINRVRNREPIVVVDAVDAGQIRPAKRHDVERGDDSRATTRTTSDF